MTKEQIKQILDKAPKAPHHIWVTNAITKSRRLANDYDVDWDEDKVIFWSDALGEEYHRSFKEIANLEFKVL